MLDPVILEGLPAERIVQEAIVGPGEESVEGVEETPSFQRFFFLLTAHPREFVENITPKALKISGLDMTSEPFTQ